jgi:hypothetical protein
MKDKKLKAKAWAHAPHPERVAKLREDFGGNECKVQFVLWADNMHLDVAGIYSKDGEPVFRPAVCAWEAWKAAWVLKTPNAAANRTP